jgi:predicted small secreted protein
MRKLMILGVVGFLLAGCNTVSGAGQDISAGANTVQGWFSR